MLLSQQSASAAGTCNPSVQLLVSDSVHEEAVQIVVEARVAGRTIREAASVRETEGIAAGKPCTCWAQRGTDESGQPVIAVLDEAPPADGSARIVHARETCTFAKPNKMSYSAAAQVRSPPEPRPG